MSIPATKLKERFGDSRKRRPNKLETKPSRLHRTLTFIGPVICDGQSLDFVRAGLEVWPVRWTYVYRTKCRSGDRNGIPCQHMRKGYKSMGFHCLTYYFALSRNRRWLSGRSLRCGARSGYGWSPSMCPSVTLGGGLGKPHFAGVEVRENSRHTLATSHSPGPRFSNWSTIRRGFR